MPDSTLDRTLSKDFLDLIDGRSPERMSKLQAEYRQTGLVALPDGFSPEGLAALRKYFDGLGFEHEAPNPDPAIHKRVVAKYGEFSMKNEFVREGMRDPRFVAFLEELTGVRKIVPRKSNIAVRFKADAPTPPWHFDGPRVSLVIPIDAPPAGAGGEFAYYPRLRRSDEPAWKRLANRLMTRLGLHQLFRKRQVLPYAAGTFIIFDGDTTYHRAMPLRAASLRRSLLNFYTPEDAAPDKDAY